MKKGSNTPQEIELKLELEPEALDQVLAHPLFEAQSRANPVTQTLQSIYFDTPDQVLRQAGLCPCGGDGSQSPSEASGSHPTCFQRDCGANTPHPVIRQIDH